ncbi:MAG TPA: pyridoxamine 5'-phosphate oxidase family protein, partial [Acidimicrobiales bacterium]|nr:pyridoxamine 5'-phosphate oxidase family protein [Acidimicrobiales bacterium]
SSTARPVGSRRSCGASRDDHVVRDPTPSLPRSPDFLTRGTGPRLPWSWAAERLETERSYWVVTVTGRGRPHARPVWGVFFEGALHLSIGAAGFRKGESSREVSVHVDSAVDVVIVDGVAEQILDAATRQRAAAVFNPKYELAADADFVNFRVAPRVAWGWSNGDVDTATKWTFEDG